MIDRELAAHAEEVLERLVAGFPMGYRPAIAWKPYRVTAGMAYYRDRVIGLSKTVLTTKDQVEDTVIHEYAHLLSFARHGRKGAGHGPGWRQAMADLGRPAKVRHNYEVRRNQPRQEVGYLCTRCGKTLLRSRRLPKRRRYLHAHCGGDLRLAFVRPSTQEPSITSP